MENGHEIQMKWGMRFVVKQPRYKNMKVSPEFLLNFLLSKKTEDINSDGTRTIHLLHFRDVPDGAEIESVALDCYSRLIVLRLWHPDFPIVPDGEMIPDVDIVISESCFALIPEGVQDGGEMIYRKEPL